MLKDILKKVFGYEEFRGNQYEIIQNILSGKNTLVIMATGGGKSLCYQLPSIVLEGMTIVISPLIALMKNQVDFLNSKGIKAAFLNSSVPKRDLVQLKADIRDRKIKSLYIAPETLNKEETIALLQSTKVSLIAVDEAHCISDWGHDFRPEYRNTQKAIQALGNPVIVALTATATPKVQSDILRTLDMEDAALIKSSFHRPNLFYQITSKQQAEKKIITFIKEKKDQSGIIYCHNRKKTEELARLLQLNNINAAPYHAGLEKATRIKNQDGFLGNKIDVITATIAFGMGIDKPDVRFIIHYDAPKSIESYYQETGRAGRDGKPAECLLLYDHADITKLQKLNRSKAVAEQQNANRLLDEVAAFVSCAACRTQQLLFYFGEKLPEKCNHCDNCKEKRTPYEAEKLVKMLLLTIQETEEKNSEPYIIKILQGIKDEQITLAGHHTLSSFGQGGDYSTLTWRSIIKQLLLEDYLQLGDYELDTLKLTEKSNKFLKKPHTISLLKDISFETEVEETNTPVEETVDPTLLKMLLALREKVAKQHTIKPYLVFQEKSLQAMTIHYPTSIELMSKIPYVGTSKAYKFGKPFIELIKEYTQKNQITPPTQISIKTNSARSGKKVQIIQQIDRKINPKDIARQNKLTYEAFIQELEEICYSGIKLNLDYYIDQLIEPEAQDDLYDYFYEVDEDNIEKAIEELSYDFTEEEIRLMHIKFLSEVAY